VSDQAPPVGSFEHNVLRYVRAAESISATYGAEAQVSHVASFAGDGDDVRACDVLARAAHFFKEHPELTIVNAAWHKRQEEEFGGAKFALELEIVPPAWYLEDVRPKKR